MRKPGFLLLLLILTALTMPATAQTYDLVIHNGRVMDPETKYDAVANIGISDGRIQIITDLPIAGEREVDATGLVVAPGFIDTHFHWTRPMGYKLALRDGVTTAMDLEAGAFGPRVGEWYDMHKGRSQVNYGTASGHEFARAFVLDDFTNGLDAPGSVVEGRSGKNWATGVLNIEQGNKLLSTIDEGLRQGALGVASTVGYFPGATAREMYEVQRVGARYGRFTAVHLRYTPGTPTTEANGAQEILANAVALDAPAVINHYNNPGWELVQELLVRFRKRGFNVWGEYYPYAAGSTTINAAFIRPETWIEELGNTYEETLQDPSTGKFLTQEEYEKVLAEDPTKTVVLYKMPPDSIPDWVRLPGIVLASDAMALPGDWDQLDWNTPYEKLPNMHPRTSGSHGRALRIARENDVPLMHVIATFSYNPARYLGDTGLKPMQERGRLQAGMVADITIFDPAIVTDNSTYEDGRKPTTGIPYVVVNGQLVVDNSTVLPDIFPGQPVRFPVEATPRFEPLDVDQWRGKFLVSPEGFNSLDSELLKESALPDKPAIRTASSSVNTPIADAQPEPSPPSGSTGTGDWYSTVRFARTTPEANQIFCPLHGKMEMADVQGLRNHPLQLPLGRLLARP